MSALFIDLDGTCLYYHTNIWMPGVVEKLSELASAGHQIHFITMTGPQDAGMEYSVEKRTALIAALPFPCLLTTSVQSPRIIIDDSGIDLIQAAHNDASSWLNLLNLSS
jgi:hypothetical protein